MGHPIKGGLLSQIFNPMHVAELKPRAFPFSLERGAMNTIPVSRWLVQGKLKI